MKLIKELEQVLQLTETDMTIFFRLLSDIDQVAMNEQDALNLVK